MNASVVGSSSSVSWFGFASSSTSFCVDVAGLLAGVTIACVMHGTLLFGVHKNLRRRPLVSCR